MPAEDNACTCKEPISAFAFNIGRSLEAFMNNYNNGLTNEHQLLQAKVMHFYGELGKLITKSLQENQTAAPYLELQDHYKLVFGIQEVTEGKVGE